MTTINDVEPRAGTHALKANSSAPIHLYTPWASLHKFRPGNAILGPSQAGIDELDDRSAASPSGSKGAHQLALEEEKSDSVSALYQPRLVGRQRARSILVRGKTRDSGWSGGRCLGRTAGDDCIGQSINDQLAVPSDRPADPDEPG